MKHRFSFLFFVLAVVALFGGCGKDNPADNDLTAPVITVQPSDQTVIEGQTATFNVTATGTNLIYQWQKYYINISGGTSATYTTPPVTMTDTNYGAPFRCVVSNARGSDTSIVAVLMVMWLAGQRYIDGGTFLMGADTVSQTAGTTNYLGDTIHQVTLSAFYMDTTEVTQADYDSLMGVNPSCFTGNMLRPVEHVTWFDAVLYCNARSKRDMLDTVYTYSAVSGTPGDSCWDLTGLTIDLSKNGYRLPTEAEWEYACKAGTNTNYLWGNDINGMDAHAWSGYNSNDTTHSVATKLANAYGLYDMVGNVLEWNNDWYASYTAGAATNPTGASTSPWGYRVVRGGSWNWTIPGIFLSANRDGDYPDYRDSENGFRCVRR